MKKTRLKLTKKINLVLAGLMSLLGLCGCKEDDQVVEYGCPYADFIVSGKVSDETGKSLENISVTIPEAKYYQRSASSNPYNIIPVGAVVKTTTDGKFEYDYNGTPTDTVRLKIKFEDKSSTPVYESDSTNVDFLPSDLKGASGWYDGSAKKEVNIKLKKKQ